MTEISRTAENAAARADEREALSSIFDDITLNDNAVAAPLDLDAGADDATLFEPGDKAVLRFTLPPSYPLDVPATASVAWATAYRVPSSIKDHVDAAVAAALASSSGDAAIFSAVAAANDALSEEAERHAAAYASWRSAAPLVVPAAWPQRRATRRHQPRSGARATRAEARRHAPSHAIVCLGALLRELRPQPPILQLQVRRTLHDDSGRVLLNGILDASRPRRVA